MNFNSMALIAILFVGIVLHMNHQSVSAQTLVGTWQEAQYGYTLVLGADYSYNLQTPQGTSVGQFGVQNNIFMMQDGYGGLYQYSIQGFSATDLILVDPNGVVMNFKRMQAAGMPSNADFEPSANARVLAEAGGYTLTDEHVNIGVRLIQFIIGQRITSAEVQELQNSSIAEFTQAPDVFLQEINQLVPSLSILEQLTDPMQIGAARQELFAAFYQATHTMKEADKPMLIQVVNRYVDVLAYDAANNLILTDKDAEAMLNYTVFAAQLNGQSGDLSEADRKAIVTELVDSFANLSLEQKQFLCSASLVWTMIEANWGLLSATEQQQVQTQYASQNQTSAHAPSDSDEVTAADLANMQAEMNARNMWFDTMSDMMLQSHVTSLNIIENIGGSDNYWEVVDYNY